MTNPLFYFDFASPNAYLAHRVIPEIETRTGARFDYVPVLLGGVFKLTGNQAPMIAFAGIKNKLAYEQLEIQRFVARHGLTKFAFNPHFPVISLRLMRGAVAAQEDGAEAFAHYVETGFRAMWEDGLKMDDPAVIAAALTAAGIDAERSAARAETPQVKQALMDNTQAAVDAGAFGIPSFLVAGELYFGKDRLRDVEEALSELAG